MAPFSARLATAGILAAAPLAPLLAAEPALPLWIAGIFGVSAGIGLLWTWRRSSQHGIRMAKNIALRENL